MNKVKYKLVMIVLIVSLCSGFLFWKLEPAKNLSKQDFFIGIDTAYDNVEDIKKLVDKVKFYTNFFGIGSSGITFNRTKLDEICQYVYDSGLYFMVYKHPTEKINQSQWIADARQRWGNHFLGIYLFDEVGGRQIDLDKYVLMKEADNYTDAANKYVSILDEKLKEYTEDEMNVNDLLLFTGDYALYWFDYEARFDVVLSEFGWNHSRLLNVALNRGAAKMHNKDWGVIITWTYNAPPYLESASELYHDMILAYLSGAKYVIILNYSPEKITSHGIVSEEHFDAIKQFWSYIHANPQRAEMYTPPGTQIAYILPKDYGWGFRGYEDRVWGFWLDETSIKIGTDVNYLLHTSPLGLDIIYDDPKYYDQMQVYSKLIFWNETVTIP